MKLTDARVKALKPRPKTYALFEGSAPAAGPAESENRARNPRMPEGILFYRESMTPPWHLPQEYRSSRERMSRPASQREGDRQLDASISGPREYVRVQTECEGAALEVPENGTARHAFFLTRLRERQRLNAAQRAARHAP